MKRKWLLLLIIISSINSFAKETYTKEEKQYLKQIEKGDKDSLLKLSDYYFRNRKFEESEKLLLKYEKENNSLENSREIKEKIILNIAVSKLMRERKRDCGIPRSLFLSRISLVYSDISCNKLFSALSILLSAGNVLPTHSSYWPGRSVLQRLLHSAPPWRNLPVPRKKSAVSLDSKK